MTAACCPREPELLAALGRGYVAPEIEEHLAACPACAELRMVAAALLDDRAETTASAPVPAAGTMWWRMRLRQRQEAESQARRWLFAGQAATLTMALALVAGLFGGEIATAAVAVAGLVAETKPLLLAAVAAGALALPLGGWLALRRS
jgi:predicted anti-sigma-YlaC factor YlaD